MCKRFSLRQIECISRVLNVVIFHCRDKGGVDDDDDNALLLWGSRRKCECHEFVCLSVCLIVTVCGGLRACVRISVY